MNLTKTFPQEILDQLVIKRGKGHLVLFLAHSFSAIHVPEDYKKLILNKIHPREKN